MTDFIRGYPRARIFLPPLIEKLNMGTKKVYLYLAKKWATMDIIPKKKKIFQGWKKAQVP